MNAVLLINQWIKKGKPYKEGIFLYDQFGNNETLKRLFHQYHSSYYFEKLTKELVAIKNDMEVVADITPKELKSVPESSNTTNNKLFELNKEKARLFREILKNRTEIKKYLNLQTNGRITIADALNVMLQKDSKGRLMPFSVTYLSYNASRKTGGELIRFPACFLRVENNTGSKVMKGEKFYSRNQPRHWLNSTRNFVPAGANVTDVKKLHIWLMFEFNGMEVVASEQG